MSHLLLLPQGYWQLFSYTWWWFRLEIFFWVNRNGLTIFLIADIITILENLVVIVPQNIAAFDTYALIIFCAMITKLAFLYQIFQIVDE